MNPSRRRLARGAAFVIAAALLASCGSADAATYTIGSGDTLSGIADRAGVSLSEVVAVNGWSDGSNHLIVPGDVIKLPEGSSAGPAVPSENTDARPEPTQTGSAAIPSGEATAPCDVLAIIEAIGDETADYADVWCENGWAWMNPNNYGDVPTPWILKAEGQTWVLQDRGTVCDPATALPWPVPAYCADI